MSNFRIGIMMFAYLLLFLLPLSSPGAEIVLGSFGAKNSESGESSKNAIWLEGQIVQGDYDQFLDIYGSGRIETPRGDLYPSYLRLSSPGGDLTEAIKIAEFVERLKIEVSMAGPCNSACFFVLVGSPKRRFAVSVGLHRPYFDRQYFSSLSANEAQNQYSELLVASKTWLERRFVSSYLIDKMINTSSFDAFVLSFDEIRRELGETSVVHEEWIAASCGFLTEEETRDWGLTIWVEMYENYTQEQLLDIEPPSLAAEVILNLQMANLLSSGYLEYIRNKGDEIDECEHNTIVEMRRDILN